MSSWNFLTECIVASVLTAYGTGEIVSQMTLKLNFRSPLTNIISSCAVNSASVAKTLNTCVTAAQQSFSQLYPCVLDSKFVRPVKSWLNSCLPLKVSQIAQHTTLGSGLIASAGFFASPAYASDPNSMLPLGMSEGVFAAAVVFSILSSQVALVRWAIARSKQIDEAEKRSNANLRRETELEASAKCAESYDPVQDKTLQLLQNCRLHGYKALYRYLLVEDPLRCSVLIEFLKFTKSRDEIDIALTELKKSLSEPEYLKQIAQIYSRGCSQQVEVDLLYEISAYNSDNARALIGRILSTSQHPESKCCALHIISRTFPEVAAIDQFQNVIETEVYDRIVRDACYYLSHIKHSRSSAILSEAALHHRHFTVRNGALCDLIQSFPAAAVDLLLYKGMVASTPEERIQVIMLLSDIQSQSARLASLQLYPFCRTIKERLYHRAFSLAARREVVVGEA